jgi:hypothetical protein
MRVVRERGGHVERCESYFDHERDGRVVTLVAFYPDKFEIK